MVRELDNRTPTVVEYRGDPKIYVSTILHAIDKGRLTYDGVANCEQTFRALAQLIDVVSPKKGTTLSVDTLVSYEKKERSGDFSEYSDGEFARLSEKGK